LYQQGLPLRPALIATKGYDSPEVEHTFTWAWALCQRLGEPPQRFPVLYGLWVFYFVGGKHRRARDQAEQFLHLAAHQEDTAPLVVAHRSLGLSLYYMGEGMQARKHFVQSVALYDPQQHRTLAFTYAQDPGVGALMYDALTLWVLSYRDQALRGSLGDRDQALRGSVDECRGSGGSPYPRPYVCPSGDIPSIPAGTRGGAPACGNRHARQPRAGLPLLARGGLDPPELGACDPAP